MATPLSDNIRALIAYANEKTQAGDTTLGSAVKTLCDGFGGGGNVPSSPFPVPRGPLSARLAALLTYANETTGAGDTTMGDAIKTLCDGYGSGTNLVFYDRLVGDGVAYIDTGVVIADNDIITMGVMCNVRNVTYFGARSGYANILDLRQQNVVANNNYLRIGSTNNVGIYTDGISKNITNVTLDLLNLTWDTGAYNGTIPRRTGLPTISAWLFSCHCTYSSPTNGASTFSTFKIVRDGETIMHLVPCTYNGEAGMWDVITEAFFGNANTSGAFTASR